MNNTDCIFFLHACRNPNYLKAINKDAFKDVYLKELFSITRDFYKNYNEIPFPLDGDKNLDQIKEILASNPQHYVLNDDFDKERNLSIFLENVVVILSNDYNRYTPKYVDEAIQAWVNWENFQLNYMRASTYMKTMEVTPTNCKEVIGEAMKIMSGFSYVGNEETAKDFYDPETHKNAGDKFGFKTEWENWDLLVNDAGSGAKLGNLIILVGAPNIGKSIFLGNLAHEYSDAGHNVLFISLEMEESDMAKRVGSNIFNIEMDDYDSHRENIGDYITNHSINRNKSNSVPRGEFLMKRMFSPTGGDIDAAVRQEEKERGIKIHIVVLDYFTEMGSSLNIRKDNSFNTYMFHKENAKELRDNAGMGEYTVVTAHQSSAIDPLAEDIDLTNLSESKCILHSPDAVIGIIQSSSMKGMREYKLKSLKARHSKFKDYYVNFKINYQNMNLKCLDMEDPNVMQSMD